MRFLDSYSNLCFCIFCGCVYAVNILCIYKYEKTLLKAVFYFAQKHVTQENFLVYYWCQNADISRTSFGKHRTLNLFSGWFSHYFTVSFPVCYQIGGFWGNAGTCVVFLFKLTILQMYILVWLNSTTFTKTCLHYLN